MSHNFLVSGKKLRNIISINDTTKANSRKIRLMAPLKCGYFRPVTAAPYIQVYTQRNRKKAVAKFSGVIFIFIMIEISILFVISIVGRDLYTEQ